MAGDILRLAIDIETWGRTLSCVGFAPNPSYSITFPLASTEEKGRWLPTVKVLCESSFEKILQNGLYDAYWLAHYGIKIKNWLWDTMAMHHALDPVEEHKLDFLASMFTRERYYKDEAKDAEEIVKYVTDLEALYVYNGKDCCVTHEVFGVLHKLLAERGMLDFYHRHYSDLFPVLLGVMRHGVRVDTKKQKAWSKRLLDECAVIRQDLAEAAGEDLFAKKDFSKVKLHRFFYEKLGLPQQTRWTKGKSGKRRTVTLDETALRNLSVKYPEKIGDWGMKVLKHREKKREADYMKGAWDRDGRIRCSYKFTTEAGRLASAKNPMGKGYNLQNIKR